MKWLVIDQGSTKEISLPSLTCFSRTIWNDQSVIDHAKIIQTNVQFFELNGSPSGGQWNDQLSPVK